MIPKDKAEFLVMQFIKHSRADNEIKPIQSAIQCALVAVNMAIKICPFVSKENCDTVEQMRADDTWFTSYWDGIRDELEKRLKSYD